MYCDYCGSGYVEKKCECGKVFTSCDCNWVCDECADHEEETDEQDTGDKQIMINDEMYAGRELDALVAIKVMGLTLRDGEWFVDGVGRLLNPTALPYYSTDIADAWQVIEHFRGARINVVINPGVRFPWFCSIRYPVEEENAGDSFSATAPLAICRAALKAVEQ